MCDVPVGVVTGDAVEGLSVVICSEKNKSDVQIYSCQ